MSFSASFLSIGFIVFIAEMILVGDLLISALLEKYSGMWPIVDYYCICGYHLKVNSYMPVNAYRAWKAIKHTDNCLSRLMFFWGRNVSLKWQNFACEDVIKKGKPLTNMDWYTYENLTRQDNGLPRLPLRLDDL